MKRICIIGGGIVGSSIAYHLGFEDGVKTVLYEKGTLGIGTTSKSAATFQIHYSEDWERKFYRYGWKLYQKWSKDPKSSVDFKKTGCLILAETDEMVYEQVEKPAEFMKSRGEETHILDSTASAEYLPSLDSQYIKKSISIPKAGYIDPYQIIREFKKSAKENGVEINTQTEVTDLIVKNNKIEGVKIGKNTRNFDIVINAAGPWAAKIGEMADIDIHLIHTIGSIFVAKLENKKNSIPTTFFYPSGGYIRDDVENNILIGKLVNDLDNDEEAGIFNPNHTPVYPNSYFKNFIIDELAPRLPFLWNAEIFNGWVGYRTVTPDFTPIIDTTCIEGLILSVGYSGKGIMFAPMGGLLTAKLAVGKNPGKILDKFRKVRF